MLSVASAVLPFAERYSEDSGKADTEDWPSAGQKNKLSAPERGFRCKISVCGMTARGIAKISAGGGQRVPRGLAMSCAFTA